MKKLGIILGMLSLALGVVGIVLPLLPTTPFLLLSTALFLRCSPRLHTWLINNRVLGEYIRNYNENRSMPLRAKISAVSLLWLSLGYCIVVVAADKWWLQLLLMLLAIAITWHILRLNTTPRKR